jgi:3-dehydroquinate dehydratase-2
MKIQIINGPNMNLIGKRETSLYGNTPFDIYLKKLKQRYPQVQIDYFQSNIEGEIIDKIQEVGFSYDGIVINAGGYTHTSVSIADALSAVDSPAVEIHITNILGRDEYRHVSFVANACYGSIMGFGLDSYRLGIEAILEMKKSDGQDSQKE